MLEGNSPNCSRLPHRYAISSPFFAAYFIISSAVLTDLFFDATNFSSHHNNCDTVSDGGDLRGGMSRFFWLRLNCALSGALHNFSEPIYSGFRVLEDGIFDRPVG